MGISNVIGTLPGLIAPQVAKAIAVDVRWRHALVAHGKYSYVAPYLTCHFVELCFLTCWDIVKYSFI